MTENQHPENVVVVVETAHPTTKQQLITAAIGLGTLIAVPVVVAGALTVANGAGKVYSKTKTKFARKPKLAIVTDLPDNTED